MVKSVTASSKIKGGIGFNGAAEEVGLFSLPRGSFPFVSCGGRRFYAMDDDDSTTHNRVGPKIRLTYFRFASCSSILVTRRPFPPIFTGKGAGPHFTTCRSGGRRKGVLFSVL
jgi:hypothetical protein